MSNKSSLFSNLWGDLSGGFASSIVAIGTNIAFGMIAMAPLGPEYIGLGVIAGMFSSIIAGLVASLFGGAPGMITGPKMPTAIVFSSLLGQLLAMGYFDPSSGAYIETLLGVAFFTVFLSGLMQLLFGVFHVGEMIKLIPYPVIAGILNGTAILIIESQLWAIIGVEKQGFLSLAALPGIIQPFTILVGITTVFLAWKGFRNLPKFIAPLLTIIIGTLLYYLLNETLTGIRLGPTIGSLSSAVPLPKYAAGFMNTITGIKDLNLIMVILPAAFAMAILGSIDSLFALVALNSLSNKTMNGNRELIGQGLGNILVSFFGGLPGSGFVARTAVNFQAGGRTRLSGVFSGLSLLVLTLLLSRFIELIPKCVIAGLIIVVSFQIVDKGSIELLKNLFSRFQKAENRHELMWNATVILLVMALVLFFNLVIAVAVGVILSIFNFIVQMSRTVIMKVYSGANVHSRILRHEKLMKLLQVHGGKISIVVLEGTIFFGTADRIAQSIEKMAEEGIQYIILDMKRVTRVDTTGARIFQQLHTRMNNKGIQVAFSYLLFSTELRQSFEVMDVTKSVDEKYFFPDTESALGFFEDQLIRETVTDEDVGGPQISLHELLGLDQLAPEDAAMIADYISRELYEKDDFIIHQGDPVKSLYFIVQGSARVTVKLPDNGRVKRLYTINYGAYFGETALWERGESPVDIQADTSLVCYRITHEDFEKMTIQEPALAMAITTMISRRMALRLNQAIDMIKELEA